jgi:hypothetical protein
MDANQHLAQKTKEKDPFFNRSRKTTKMKIATCSCGEKLLVVPDLAAMNKAIDAHLSKHNCDVLFLIEEIFKAISL